jgi:molecular chaperone HscA
MKTIVGIDFGTTNSLVAWADDEVKLASFNDISLLKSIIAYTQYPVEESIQINDFYAVIGEKALQYSNHILSPKRYIADNPIFKIKIENNTIELSAIEIVSHILKYLKLQAEKSLNIEVSRAIFTIPAHFDERARYHLKEAAYLSGIEPVRIINEPTAAAIAYGVQPKSYFMVYDLGGGTFDVSILKIIDGVIRVISTAGNNHLGGDNIDDSIIELYHNKTNIKLSDISKIRAMKTGIEHDPIISQEELNELFQSLFNKTIPVINDAITAAKLQYSDITSVILAGGCSKIPLIKDKLKERFNVVESSINPDEVVAIGAALQAKALLKPSHVLLDVVPLSLGIEIFGGLVDKLIYRNTPIPISVTRLYTNQVDNQKAFKIHIVQGESDNVALCRSLFTITLQNLPLVKAGELKLKITFNLDADGILHVNGEEMMSHKSCDIDIKPSYNLTENIMLNLIQTSIKSEN